jgi:hypothetical protein
MWLSLKTTAIFVLHLQFKVIVMEYFVGCSAAIVAINMLARRKGKNGMTFVAYKNEEMPETIVVDCSHKTSKQLTHHLKGENQKRLTDFSLRGDSSTDAVLNAISSQSKFIDGLTHVSSNHFDVDSFTSCWCCVYPQLTAQYEAVLREISRIGDFRELRLDNEYQHTALQLTCWLNSEEKRLFYKPIESKITVATGEEEGITKFEYFLPKFGDVLINPLLYKAQWIEEYERVVREYDIINNSLTYSDSKLGIIVVNLDDPQHYYR